MPTTTTTTTTNAYAISPITYSTIHDLSSEDKENEEDLSRHSVNSLTRRSVVKVLLMMRMMMMMMMMMIIMMMMMMMMMMMRMMMMMMMMRMMMMRMMMTVDDDNSSYDVVRDDMIRYPFVKAYIHSFIHTSFICSHIIDV